MILIAYDGSEDGIAAIEAAGRLMSGQPALVLTVWEPFTMILSRTPTSMGSIGGYGDISHIDAASRAGAQRQAAEGARLAREHGLRATGREAARVGSIAEAILSESDRSDAELIVVGTRGLGAVGSLLLGGVSHTIVQHAGRPVMVVPAPSLAARRAAAQSERGSR